MKKELVQVNDESHLEWNQDAIVIISYKNWEVSDNCQIIFIEKYDLILSMRHFILKSSNYFQEIRYDWNLAVINLVLIPIIRFELFIYSQKNRYSWVIIISFPN